MARSDNDIANLLPPIVDEPATCQTHGDYTARYVVVGTERRGGRCPQCIQDENKAQDRERQERRDRLAREERARQFEAAGVTPRMLGKTFDDYVADSPEQQRALKHCIALVEHVRKSPRRAPCLILAGMPGNGKTHLACAIVAALHGQRDAVRRNMADIVDDIRATWAKGATESRTAVVERYASLDLLLVDEVGAGYGTDSERAEIFRIIDRRYERMLPVVLITNLTVEELGREIGDRVIDRMREDGGQLLAFTGSSHRRTAK